MYWSLNRSLSSLSVWLLIMNAYRPHVDVADRQTESSSQSKEMDDTQLPTLA